MPRPSAFLPCLALGSLLLSQGLVQAFPLSGQLADEVLAPALTLRGGWAPSVTSWSSTLGLPGEGGNRRTPLAAPLSDGAVGVELLPYLAPAQAALAALLADPGYRLRLGAGSATATMQVIRLPYALDLGITSWLTVGAVVPVVRRRLELTQTFRGEEGNVGFSPGLEEPQVVSTFLSGLESALSEAQVLVAELCAGGGETQECQGGLALLAEGQAFRTGLAQAYLTEFFPVEGSAAGNLLEGRMAALASGLEGLGVGFGSTLPLASRLDRAGWAALLEDPRYGVGLEPLESWESLWELGDVEFHLHARILERVARDSAGVPTSAHRIVGGVRLVLPTGEPADPGRILVPGAGRGVGEVELRVRQDLVRSRWGILTDVKVKLPGEATVQRRVSPASVPFPPLSSTRSVEWAPAGGWSLDVAPRWALAPELSLSLGYGYARKGNDVYTAATNGAGAPDPLPFPVEVLGEDTSESVHRGQVTLHYSLVDAHRRGMREGRPFELLLRYDRVMGGSGGRVPVTGRLQAGLRMQLMAWGS